MTKVCQTGKIIGIFLRDFVRVHNGYPCNHKFNKREIHNSWDFILILEFSIRYLNPKICLISCLLKILGDYGPILEECERILNNEPFRNVVRSSECTSLQIFKSLIIDVGYLHMYS